MNKDTKNKLILILVILICLWLLLYLIPELFISLFDTLLGKFILFIIVILVGSYNVKYGIFLGIMCVILFRFSQLSKEGFTWSKESTREFLYIQDTNNPNIIFDVDVIQKNQASQEELNYFLQNGKWPWSKTTQALYIEAIDKNPYVQVSPYASLEETRKIYNEAAIKMILSQQTKEGQFLISGVKVPGSGSEEVLPSGFGDFAYNSGLQDDKTKDIIRCNMDNASLERIHYTGKEGIYGSQTSITTPVEYSDLEATIPGFSFVNGPCNPCGAIREKPDYSCAFNLKTKDQGTSISSIWKNLWGL